MTRETKMGLMLVLVLASVFGFLVYKRAMRPGEVVAATEETTTDETESADDGTEAGAETESFGLDNVNEEPPPMRIAAAARTIPSEDSDDVNDPFNTAAAPASRAPAANIVRLPKTIPDEDEAEQFEPPRMTPGVAVNAGPDLDANDPFQNAGDAPAESDGDPFNGGTDAIPANSGGAVVETEVAADTEEPFALEMPPANAGTAVEVATDAPELGFDDAEPVAEKPAASPRLPVAAPSREEENPFESEPASEGSTSIQVRSKLPEAPLDFGDTNEPQPLKPDAEFESKELPAAAPTPELMLDDSEEDRYGGYEPIELTAAVSRTAVAEAEAFAATPRRVVSDPEPIAKSSNVGTTPPTIAGEKYVIQSGDNFWSISQRKYGTGRFFQAIAAHNQSRVPDAAKMKPGVEIALPAAEVLQNRYATLVPNQGAEEPTAAVGAGTANGEFLRGSNGQPMYRVGSGDTLSGIAQKHLGRSRRWEQILEMNRDILKDGNTLKLGAVLRLPNDANDVQLSNQPRLFR